MEPGLQKRCSRPNDTHRRRVFPGQRGPVYATGDGSSPDCGGLNLHGTRSSSVCDGPNNSNRETGLLRFCGGLNLHGTGLSPKLRWPERLHPGDGSSPDCGGLNPHGTGLSLLRQWPESFRDFGLSFVRRGPGGTGGDLIRRQPSEEGGGLRFPPAPPPVGDTSVI